MVKEIPESVADLWAAVSGFDVTEKDVWIIGERVNNIERAFNIREGFTRKADILPRRFMEEAMPEGASKGEKVTKKDFNLMLDEYYEARGWDKKGIPRKSTLDRLGMSDVAENLEAYTKLSK
jgi:aldehyde:ferredoxin oxidoreductase